MVPMSSAPRASSAFGSSSKCAARSQQREPLLLGARHLLMAGCRAAPGGAGLGDVRGWPSFRHAPLVDLG